MDDTHKTKAQLISELQELRQQVSRLSRAETQQNSNASFFPLAEAAASPIFVFRDSVFLYANPATARLTGYTIEELIGRDMWTLVHPEFRDRIQSVSAFQRGEEISPRSEFKIITKQGETRWINAGATVTEFRGMPAVLTVAYDTTEYKLAQEALKISEDRYRSIMETALEAIWVVDPQANTTFVNEHLSEMLRYDKSELLGRSALDFVHPEDRHEAVQYLERGRSGIKEQHDFRFRRKDGAEIWTMLSTTPLFDAAGAFAGGLAMLIDISARKQAERALKQSEALLQATLENLPFELWARDTAGRCIIQNPYSVLQWGNQIGNLLEKTAPDLPTLELWRGQHRRALAGEVVKAEFEIVTGDQAGWYYTVVAPICVDGEVTDVLRVNIDITERRRSEEALRESERRFRALFENSAEAITLHDATGKILYASPNNERLWGFRGDEVVARSSFEFIHPDDAELVKRLLATVIQNPGETLTSDFRLRAKDGTWRHTEVVGRNLLADPSIQAIVVNFRDISERKRAEAALKKTQERLQHVLLSSPAMIYVHRPEANRNKLEWVSESVTRLIGYDQSEALSEGWWAAHLHPDDRDRTLASVTREFTEDRLVMEYRFEHRDGGYLWVHDDSRLLRDESGRPIEVIGSWVDVTERREAEAALRDSEERFRLLVTSMNDTVFTLDREHRVTALFGSLTNRSDLDVDHFIGKTARDLFGAEAAGAHEEAAARALAGEQVVYEWSLIHDQNTLHYQTSLSPLRNHRGEVTGLVGVGRDISALRHAEKSIRFQANLLEKVQQAAIATDPTGNINYWNRFAEELYGWSAAEVLDRNILEVIPADATVEQASELMHHLRNGNGWSGEFLVRHKEGTTFSVMAMLSPLYDDEGGRAGIVGISYDITERKKAEEALLASEERYRDLVENARDIIYSHDLKGNFTSVNKVVEQITGYTCDEALNLNVTQSIAPEYVETAQQMVAAKLAGQKETVYDLEIMGKDGRRITVEVNTRLILQDDVPVGIHGIARDVTERKRAEQALRESRSHLQAILDNCPAMIFEKDLDGRYLLVNRRFERTFNAVGEQVLGRTDDELFPPEMAAGFRASDGSVLAKGSALEFEECASAADGLHTYIVHKFPLRDVAGDIYGVGGISTDISERKRAEEALKRSEERFRSYFELGLIGIAITSPTKGWIEVNDEICEILGYDRHELWQITWAELTHPDDLAADVANFDRVVAGEIDGYSLDKRFIRKDGEIIYTTIAVRCLRRNDGSVDYFVALIQDITERKRIENALRNSERKYKDIVTFSPIGIYQALPDGDIVTANVALAQILGYESPDDLLRINLERDVYVDPADRRKLIETYEAKGFSGEIEVQWKRRDGTPFWIQLNAHAVKDAQFGTQYFEGFVLDITARKRAEALLQSQTAHLAALLDIELEISSESDLSRVLDIVTRRAAELLRASHCGIFIYDSEREELNIVASLNPVLKGSPLKRGEGLAGYVTETGCAQVIEDYSEWEGRAAVYEDLRFGPSMAAPLKWQQTVIGAISLSREPKEDRFTDDDSRLLQQLAAEAAIAIHQATLIDELTESRRRLQVLSHRLIDAQEAERKRLARELHDQIGQALTAIQISLQSARPLSDGATANAVEDCLAIIDESLQLVHDLSLDLRPSLLDDLGLGAALRWYVERATSRADLLTRLNVDVLGRRFSSDVETACFRIAQESLTNVVRHASARTVVVTLAHKEDCLKLTVKDDGVGFDVHEALDRKGPNTSLGLQGMRERASALGGTVKIKSNPGNGTAIEASFPL